MRMGRKTKEIAALILALWMICSVCACATRDAESSEPEPTDTTAESTAAEKKDEAKDEGQDDENVTPTPDAGGDQSGEDSGTPPVPVRMIDLAQGSRAQYTVVSDAPIYDTMAQEFAVQLTQATGISFFSKKSDEKQSASGKKIFVGKSPVALLDDDSVLSYCGTLSTEKGKNIYISACNKESLQLALDQFLEIVETKKLSQQAADGISVQVSAEELFFLKNPESYPYEDATLLGASLSEYVIVLPEHFTVYDRFVADELSAAIGADTGARLEYVKDSDTISSEYRIVIGKTKDAYSTSLSAQLAEDSYLLRNDGKSVYIVYDNYLVSGETPEVLVKLYRANATEVDEKKSFDYSAYLFERPEGTDLRLMSSNITVVGDARSYEIANNINYVDRMEILSQMYLKYLPDFIGLQEVEYSSKVDMYDAMIDRVGHKYSMLTDYYDGHWSLGAPNKEVILYLTDVWQVEASGQGRYNPMHFWYWGLFSRIDDPDTKVIVMDVHYAGYNVRVDGISNGDKINSIYHELSMQYPDIPIFVMGDMNAQYHHSTFGHTVVGTTLDSASRLLRDAQGNPAWGDHYTSASLNHSMYATPIDHILLPTDKAEALSYRFINEALMNISSGHRPIMADIRMLSSDT